MASATLSVSGDGTIAGGTMTVDTAGTPERLLAAAAGRNVAHALTLVAKRNNTGRIFIGGSDISSDIQRGLAAGDSVSFASKRGIDMREIWIDATVSAEGVDIYAVLSS